MELKEINGDLFSCVSSIGHCISNDFKMGKGIAKQFKTKYPKICESSNYFGSHLAVFNVENRFIYNLITKEKFWQKPTYTSLRVSLEQMKGHIEMHKVKCIGLPAIGCGLDKLNWKIVKNLIREIFKNVPVKIKIYHKREKHRQL